MSPSAIPLTLPQVRTLALLSAINGGGSGSRTHVLITFILNRLQVQIVSFKVVDTIIEPLISIICSLLIRKTFSVLQIDDPLSNLSASVGKRCNFFKLQERVGAPCGSQTTSNDFYCRLQQQGFLQSLPHSDLRNKESNVSRIQVYPHKM